MEFSCTIMALCLKHLVHGQLHLHHRCSQVHTAGSMVTQYQHGASRFIYTNKQMHLGMQTRNKQATVSYRLGPSHRRLEWWARSLPYPALTTLILFKVFFAHVRLLHHEAAATFCAAHTMAWTNHVKSQPVLQGLLPAQAKILLPPPHRH